MTSSSAADQSSLPNRPQPAIPTAPIGATGLERPHDSSQETDNPLSGGADSGALPSLDPRLVALIDAWPRLPEPIRAGIAAMLEAARREGGA